MESTDELRLGLGKVEGGALALSEAGNEIDDRQNQHERIAEQVPVPGPAIVRLPVNISKGSTLHVDDINERE